MRRVALAIVGMVLAGALWHGIAAAAPADFSTAFAMRTFGTVPSAAPAFAPTTKNALRGLAFTRIVPVALPMPKFRRAVAVAVPLADGGAVLDLRSALDRYASFVPKPAVIAGAGPGAVAMARYTINDAIADPPAYAPVIGESGDGAIAPVFGSALRDATIGARPEIRAGGFRTTGSTELTRLPALAADDQRLQTLSSIGVGRKLDVHVGSDYERLSTGADAALATRTRAGFANAAIGELPGYDAPHVAGSYSDVTARGVAAGLAVPIGRFTVGMQYGTQRYTGALGSPDFTPNLDTSKYSYIGNVTFALPHSSSSIVVSARQFRYQDNLVPSNTTYQTRADAVFTVKF